MFTWHELTVHGSVSGAVGFPRYLSRANEVPGRRTLTLVGHKPAFETGQAYWPRTRLARQSRLAQRIPVLGHIFLMPVRPQRLAEIGDAQRRIEVQQSRDRLPRLAVAPRLPFTWKAAGTMPIGCSKHEQAPLAVSPKPWPHR